MTDEPKKSVADSLLADTKGLDELAKAWREGDHAQAAGAFASLLAGVAGANPVLGFLAKQAVQTALEEPANKLLKKQIENNALAADVADWVTAKTRGDAAALRESIALTIEEVINESLVQIVNTQNTATNEVRAEISARFGTVSEDIAALSTLLREYKLDSERVLETVSVSDRLVAWIRPFLGHGTPPLRPVGAPEKLFAAPTFISFGPDAQHLLIGVGSDLLYFGRRHRPWLLSGLGEVHQATWNEDGSLVAICYGSIIDIRSTETLQTVRKEQLLGKGRVLGFRLKRIIYQAAGSTYLRELNHEGRPDRVSVPLAGANAGELAADGVQIVLLARHKIQIGQVCPNPGIKAYPWRVESQLEAKYSDAVSAWSASGRFLAIRDKRGISVYDAPNAESVPTFIPAEGDAVAMRFSPDEMNLIVLEQSGDIRWFRVLEAGEATKLAAKNFRPKAIAFRPDGRLVVCGVIDERVQVFEHR